MNQELIYFLAINIVCSLVFLYLLFKTITGFDSANQKLYFSLVLISHIVYFIVSAIWILIYNDIIPRSKESMRGIDILMYIVVSYTAYFWCLLTEANQDSKIIKRKDIMFYMTAPILVYSVFYTIAASLDFSYYIDNNNQIQNLGFYIVLMTLPGFYMIYCVISVYIKTRKKAFMFRRKMYHQIAYPLILFVTGIAQSVIWFLGYKYPILAVGSTFGVILVYINHLEDLISSDSLTGLYTRYKLNNFIRRKLRKKEDVYMFISDIDNFKGINDTYGHSEGDKALIEVSKIVAEAAHNYDKDIFVARFGGDEFLFFESFNSEEDVLKFVDLVENYIRENSHLDFCKKIEDDSLECLNVSVTIGYTKFTRDKSLPDMVSEADKMLYEKKKERKNAAHE